MRRNQSEAVFTSIENDFNYFLNDIKNTNQSKRQEILNQSSLKGNQHLKQFQRQQRKHQKSTLILEQICDKNRSPSPTLKDYKEYLSKQHHPWKSNKLSISEFSEPSYLKNDDVSNTFVELNKHLLPRSYNLEKLTQDTPPFNPYSYAGREFGNGIIDASTLMDPKFDYLSRTKAKQIFSKTAQIAIIKNQEKYLDKIKKDIEQKKFNEKNKRKIIEMKNSEFIKWKPANTHKEYFTDISPDTNLLKQKQDLDKFIDNFTNVKSPYRRTKRVHDYFTIEKTCIE